ncbi:MAG: hypothetical protein Q9220_002511 [cf. Caloplaca sp. 1 TL-2023]
MPSNPKTSGTGRRVSSNLAKVSTPPNPTRGSKGSKGSKVICLKLPSKLLQRFAPTSPDQPPSASPPPKQTQDNTTKTPNRKEEGKSVNVKPEASSPPVAAAASETPQPSANEPTPNPTTKASSPQTGSKRGLGAGVDNAKPRARPGPKKKIKLDDTTGENGGSTPRAGTGNASVPAHKLGPKANQGAINAGLRALDRTGKPCRKWEKNGFRLRTFTGVTWELPTWRAPPNSLLSEDSPEKGSLPTSNSQSKENNSSSHVGSDNSSATPDARMKMDLINSRIPGITIAS